MINIYVGNLPYDTNEDDLAQLFSQHGEVGQAKVIMDRESGRARGFGFVEMPNDSEGKAAIEALNGSQFGDRALTVNEARARSEGGRGGGGGRRNFGGGGGGGNRW